MASNTQGIQQLLAAEKKAADKVGEARKRNYSTFFILKSNQINNFLHFNSLNKHGKKDHVSEFHMNENKCHVTKLSLVE